MTALPEPLEAQLVELETSDLGAAGDATAALRHALAADSTVAELVARMTPEELRDVLNKMAWAAYYQGEPAAAEREFQVEFSYLETELQARTPQISSLEETPEPALAGSEVAGFELSD